MNKRDLLKGITVGTAWSTPAVTSVLLPVHASTSCEAGCFVVDCAQCSTGSLFWNGVDEVIYYDENLTCSGGEITVSEAVIASSTQEASVALQCEFQDTIALSFASSEFTGPCEVYFCD